jgi:type II secretory pathway component PulL
MKGTACLIRQTSSSWIVSIGDIPPLVLSVVDTKPAGLAHSVADYLERAKPKYGACGDKIVLCPESRAVLFATSPIPDSLKTKDRQQLKFHAESLLPLDAEEMAADFVLTARDLRVMAIDRNEWQPIIDALAGRNLHFRWIAPAAVLALEEAKRTIGDGARVIIWEEEGACELWQIDAKGVFQWTHLASGMDDRLLAMRLFAAQVPGARSWLAINCSPTTLEQLSQLSSVEIRASELQSQGAYAAAAANRLCKSSWEPWFDLRDGTLAGGDRYRALYGWIQAAAATVAGLLLAVSIACYWRSARDEAEIASIQEANERLYRAAFPDERVPLLVSRSISNAHSRLQGETDGKGEFEVVPSALELLHAALTALSPAEPILVRASSLQITNGELTLSATFQSEKDAGIVAVRLKEVGIDTGPLSTNKEKGKTVATFQGKLAVPAKALPTTSTTGNAQGAITY